MRNLLRILALLWLVACIQQRVQSQLLHADGINIVDDEGSKVLWRGVGLGGWMLQEGYMLNTSGPQHEIEAKVVDVVGEEKKDEFYEAWLANHMRKIDVDSMASWGYNMIRLPMHYKLFTPPIEDEQVEGEITWIDKGFEMTDALLEWCEANEVYLILDMHAAPGGQGENKDISDYDPTKPSLWESEANQDKMVALWKKLAERYANEPWIGAYDIINEPNWGFQDHDSDPNGCSESENTLLWDLQRRITEAIREVDQNHIVVIEGNCWGNNYNGLPTLWDDNLVISYHKYWNGNDQSSIQGMLDMRSSRNVPIWLGETGENSNTWYTDCVTLLESNDMGWSWWPLKKLGNNNPLQIKLNDNYQAVLDYWNGTGEKPSVEDAFEGLMQYAEDLKLENNIYHRDVVDAIIRQPHADTTLPFKNHVVFPEEENIIHFSDYDLGKVGFAYDDEEYTNTTGSAGGQAWNLGYTYRNDGVDIQSTSDEDEAGNGYNVGWTINDEWMQYTIDVDSSAAYRLKLRYSGSGTIHFELDGSDLSGPIELPATGSYDTWADLNLEDVVLYEGIHQLRVMIDKEGMNLNYFSFFLTSQLSEVVFEAISAMATEDGVVTLNLNKQLDSDSELSVEEWKVVLNDVEVVPTDVSLTENSAFQIKISIGQMLIDIDELYLSYEGTGILSEDGGILEAFENLQVVNNCPQRTVLPGKIQAEDFYVNNGLELEETADTGGGYNIAYTSVGDYLEYLVNVSEAGTYKLEVRVACLNNAGELLFQQLDTEGEVLSEQQLYVPVTGDWQSWETVSTIMELNEGPSTLRVEILDTEFNVNWFNFSGPEEEVTLAVSESEDITIYPNPSRGKIMLTLPVQENPFVVRAADLTGRVVFEKSFSTTNVELDFEYLANGVYLLQIELSSQLMVKKLILE